MAGLCYQDVTMSLRKITEFMCPYLPLANAHPSNFITENQWSNLITETIQHQLMSLSADDLKTLPCFPVSTKQQRNIDNDTNNETNSVSTKTDTGEKCDCKNHPKILENKAYMSDVGQVNSAGKHFGIKEFCDDAFSSTLDGCKMTIQSETLMSFLDVEETNNAFVRDFMSHKKGHEVEVMSRVCAQLVRATNSQLVIDFGSGKGYLGNHLCLQYNIPVLGIDAMATNTQSAEKRMDLLGKQWKGLSLNVKSSADGRTLTKREKKLRSRNSEARQNEFIKDETIKNVSKENTDRRIEGIDDELKDHSSNNESKKSCELNRISRYVPVTTFVDKNTDFMAIALDNFPEIFRGEFVSEDIYCEEMRKQIEKESANPYLTETNSGEYRQEEICNIRSDLSSEVSSEKLTTRSAEQANSNPTDKRKLIGNCNLLLSGLHTCGNLASTTLHLFVNNSDLETVCSVGCCYNLLTEEFSTDDSVTETQGASDTFHGFPMSQFLKEQNLSLGASARNLASQSIHRISSSEEQLQGERFYPRALLEVLVQDVCGRDGVQWRGLRNLERKCSSTEEYLRKACEKLNISHLISEELIQTYITRYADCKQKLAAFFQLRAVLAPCIESLILLDRVCYLLEQGNIRKVYLVRLFDPIISPRCYGIVAFKH